MGEPINQKEFMENLLCDRPCDYTTVSNSRELEISLDSESCVAYKTEDNPRHCLLSVL